MKLSGADIIVKSLIKQGVEVVFGYPGGQIIDVYDSLYKYQNEIHHVLTAHEQGASHAADGYARASGRVGVVLATSGPGATNLITGIATAYLDSIPMVAITGNVLQSQIGTDSFQEIDITGITLPITKHNYFVSRAEDLADIIKEAFELAISGRPGPVLIDVPKDVQKAIIEWEEGERFEKALPFSAKDMRIKQAVKLINACKKPYVYFGGGIINSGANDHLIELSRKIDAPIGCSLMGISAIPTNQPLFLGMEGMHGKYASSMAMKNADLIIALGARFNDRATGNVAKFPKQAKIVHIDIDGSELNKNLEASVGLRGDIKLTLEKLIPQIKTSKKIAWWKEIDSFRQTQWQTEDLREGLTPKNVLSTLNKFLNPDYPVVTDVGQHQMWAAQYVNFSKNRKFITSGGLGTMGFGMGAAMGASYSTGKKSVLITGDGCFGMNLNELATAVTYNVPLVVVLFNNGVLGMVRQWQTLFFDKHYSNTVLNRKTNFVELCKAFGADAERVDDLSQLDGAYERAFNSKVPYVIEVMVDKDEFVLPMLPPGGSFDDIITKVGK